MKGMVQRRRLDSQLTHTIDFLQAQRLNLVVRAVYHSVYYNVVVLFHFLFSLLLLTQFSEQNIIR